MGYWTYHNVRREQALQYHDEFTLYQIEKLLGLHEILPEKLRWIPDAPHIFNSKHVDSTYGFKPVRSSSGDPVEDWVQGRLAKQLFLNQVVLSYVFIFFLPLFGIGILLLMDGINALLVKAS